MRPCRQCTIYTRHCESQFAMTWLNEKKKIKFFVHESDENVLIHKFVRLYGHDYEYVIK